MQINQPPHVHTIANDDNTHLQMRSEGEREGESVREKREERREGGRDSHIDIT